MTGRLKNGTVYTNYELCKTFPEERFAQKDEIMDLKGYTWTSNSKGRKGWLIQTVRYRPKGDGNAYMDVKILQWGVGKFPPILDPRLPKSDYSFHVLSKRYLSTRKVRVYGYLAMLTTITGHAHFNPMSKKTKAQIRKLGMAISTDMFYGNQATASNAAGMMTTVRTELPKGVKR